MTQIRAFVGHSFAAEDEAVIATFLEYFNQMKGALPDFDWINAKAAEPKELADKVLSLVEGKNVFIGICTQRERVLPDEKLRPSWLDPNRKSVLSIDIEWKTSDWIVQEIGLAIGRKMDLVLLVENGCRKPGGLQGDVEFIQFDRSAPERAFGRLLEMMKALAPSSAAGEVTAPDIASDATDDTQTHPAKDHETPDATWDRDQYELTYMWRWARGDRDQAEKVAEAYLRTPEAKDPEKKAEWHSFAEACRIRMSREGSLQRLRELKHEFPDNVQISSDLAGALAEFGHNKEAALEYLATAEIAKSDTKKAERLRSSAAVQFAKSGDTIAAEDCLLRVRNAVLKDPEHELNLLYRMKDIAEYQKDEELQVELLERIVDIRPDDHSNRFDLAYKYMQLNYDDLSLHHYLQIPSALRSPGAWNNLGVAFQRASLPAKAIDAYRRSAAQGETLAMSNLAHRMMSVGLLDEANAELQKALKIENFHRNVGEAISQLRDIPEKENAALEEAEAKLKSKAEFFRRLGRALSLPGEDPKGIWDGPVCKLAIEAKDGKLVAVGQYEVQNSGIAPLFGAQKTGQFTITYTGTIIGRRVFGRVKRKSDSGSPSSLLSLGSEDDGVEFAMIIDERGEQLSVMESPSSFPRFYEIKRAPDTP